MLARGPALVLEARAAGRAVPAFTVYTLESVRAVCDAAERTGLPVILQAGSSSYGETSRSILAAAALAAARDASVPVGVHLDHSTDPEEIRDCLALGYTSVMVDGSQLPFAENVALTRAVVAHAHDAGVWVEAELGALAGDEDASTGVASGSSPIQRRRWSSWTAPVWMSSPQRWAPSMASRHRRSMSTWSGLR